jgi:hypothetical protein
MNIDISTRKMVNWLTAVLVAFACIGISACQIPSPGETVKPGRIIFTNETIPGSSPVSFKFSFSYGAQVGHAEGASLHGGEQIDSGFTLPPGNYAVTETIPEGWKLSTSVHDASGGSFSSGNSVTIALAAGETVTVKFSNTPQNFPSNTTPFKLGSIVIIVKTGIENTSDSFDFTMSYGAEVGYPNGIKIGGGQLFDSGFTLPPGNYVINEALPSAWELQSVLINDTTGGSSASGTTAAIALAEGETVTVTFTNSVLKTPKTGRIILMVQTTPDGVPDNFNFTLSYGAQLGYPNGIQIRDGQLLDSGFTLPANRSYTVNEVLPEGWQLTKIDISVGNSGKPYVSSLTTPPPPFESHPDWTQATIGLGEGETVVVTFYNNIKGITTSPPVTSPVPYPVTTSSAPTVTTAPAPSGSLGRIIVRKFTNPAGMDGSFSFAPGYGAQSGYPNGFMLRNGQQIDSGFTITPGTYTIVEYPPAGWQCSISIYDPTGGSSATGNTAAINLASGETVTVTYVNNYTGPVTTTAPTTTPAPTTITTPPTTLPSTGVPGYRGTLTVIRNADITSWDPVQNWTDDVLDLVYQRLWQGDWTKGLAGGYGANVTGWLAGDASWDLKTGAVAESCNWTVDSSSGRGIIIFKVRQGIRWQTITNSGASSLVNGRQLTADDVLYCLRRAVTENTAYIKTHYPELTGAVFTKTGDWEITVSVPSGSLDSARNIFGCFVYIYPPELISVYANLANWQNAVGSGPFIPSQFIPGSSTSLVRNPNFWMTDPVGPGQGSRLPYLDAVKVLVIPDVSTRLAALKTGKIDYLRGVSADDAPSLIAQRPALRSVSTSAYYSFWWPWIKNYSGEDAASNNARGWPQYLWYDTNLKTQMGY